MSNSFRGLLTTLALMLLPCQTDAQSPLAPLIETNTARVVTVCDTAAVNQFQPRQDVVRAMVARGITNLMQQGVESAAWRRLAGTQDVVGIKVYSAPGRLIGTRVEVVAAVIEGLLASGLPATNIIVWDKQAVDLRNAGFTTLAPKYGVRVVSSEVEGFDSGTYYENALLGRLNASDTEFGSGKSDAGRFSFVARFVAKKITKIISIAPLLNHNEAGVTGHLFSVAMGSVDNTLRFDSGPEQLAAAVPEIYALPSLSDHVALCITDALVCQYLGGESPLLHYSATLEELRFSTDPVALDTLSIQELDRQRQLADIQPVKPPKTLLQNASLLELGISDPGRIHVEKCR